MWTGVAQNVTSGARYTLKLLDICRIVVTSPIGSVTIRVGRAIPCNARRREQIAA